MLGIGIVVAQLGYWIAYYGFDLLTGGNDSFLDLGVPGRWKGAAPKDTPGGAPGDKTSGTGIAAPGTQVTDPPANPPPPAQAGGPPANSFASGSSIGAPALGAGNAGFFGGTGTGGTGDVGSQIPGRLND